MKIKEFLNTLKKYSNCTKVYVDVAEMGYDVRVGDFLVDPSNPIGGGYIIDDSDPDEKRISWREFLKNKDAKNNYDNFAIALKHQTSNSNRTYSARELIKIFTEIAHIAPDIDVVIAWQDGNDDEYNWDNLYNISGIDRAREEDNKLVIYSFGEEEEGY